MLFDNDKLMLDCKAGVCPNLMTRFREEHYATRGWKAAFTPRGDPKTSVIKSHPRPGRAQYFQKSLSVRKAIARAQAAQIRMFT